MELEDFLDAAVDLDPVLLLDVLNVWQMEIVLEIPTAHQVIIVLSELHKQWLTTITRRIITDLGAKMNIENNKAISIKYFSPQHPVN